MPNHQVEIFKDFLCTFGFFQEVVHNFALSSIACSIADMNLTVAFG